LTYEVFVGDPIGPALRYSRDVMGQRVVLRGALGVGGVVSYLNLHIIGDALFEVPIAGGADVLVGLGGLTGLRFQNLNAGVGLRMNMGMNLNLTESVALGFLFSPLVVKAFDGRAYPGVSLGFSLLYSPKAKEEAPEPKSHDVAGGETSLKNVKGDGKVERPRRTSTSTAKEKVQEEEKSERRVDRKAAEREYKLGLQAYANGNLRKAKYHFEAALRYDPSYDKARIALEKVKRQLGE